MAFFSSGVERSLRMRDAASSILAFSKLVLLVFFFSSACWISLRKLNPIVGCNLYRDAVSQWKMLQ